MLKRQKKQPRLYFRIAHRSLLTGYEGRGSWQVSNVRIISDIIADANEQHAGVINHWMETKPRRNLFAGIAFNHKTNKQ